MQTRAAPADVASWAAPEDFTIALAEPCRQAWLERLAGLGEGEAFGAIDLSAVTRIDTAAIQLLLALDRSLKARGLALRLAAPSGVVQEALALYGLGSLTEMAA